MGISPERLPQLFEIKSMQDEFSPLCLLLPQCRNIFILTHGHQWVLFVGIKYDGCESHETDFISLLTFSLTYIPSLFIFHVDLDINKEGDLLELYYEEKLQPDP